MKNKIDWVKFHTRDFSLFRYYVYLESNKLPFYKKNFGKVFDYTITVPNGKLIGYWHDRQELHDLTKALYRVACKDFKTFEKYSKDIFGWMNEFIEFNKKIKIKELASYTNSQLLTMFNVWYKKYLHWQIGIYFYFTLEAIVTDNFSSQLEEYLRKRGELNKLVDWSSLVMSPEKMNAVAEENLEALKTAQKIKLYPQKKEELITKFYKKFIWLPCYDIKDQEYGREYFVDRIKKLLKLDKLKITEELDNFTDDFKKRKINFKKFLTNIDDKKLQEVSQIMHWLVFYKDHRDDLRRRAGYEGKKFMNFLAKKFDLNLLEINYLLPDEIRSWLKGEPTVISEIKKRIPVNYVLLSTPGRIDFFVGEKAKKIISREFPVSNKKVESIKGVVGCKGLAKGRVVIVRHSINCHKVKIGDVLVAVTTHPEYVPAMKRATAIVTDEGGITSHAAIVAREMRKPCIVGTKNATQVLQDGDMVEVDANLGIVKVVK